MSMGTLNAKASPIVCSTSCLAGSNIYYEKHGLNHDVTVFSVESTASAVTSTHRHVRIDDTNTDTHEGYIMRYAIHNIICYYVLITCKNIVGAHLCLES